MKTLPRAAALALALVAPDATAQGLTRLRYRYAAGQRARYVTRTTQALPGAAAPTVITGSHEVETLRVRPDGAADQRLRIVRLDIAGEAVPEAMRTRAAADIAGVTIEFTQDARGAITARHTVGAVPDALRPVLDDVVQSLDQMGALLPAAPVAVGAAWHDQRTIHVLPGGGLDMSVDVTYTLRQVRGAGPAQTALLGVSMTLSTPPGANVRGVRLNGSGAATGEAAVELGRGRMGRGHTAGSLRVQMNVGGRAIDLESAFTHDMTPEAPAARPPGPAARPQTRRATAP